MTNFCKIFCLKNLRLKGDWSASNLKKMFTLTISIGIVSNAHLQKFVTSCVNIIYVLLCEEFFAIYCLTLFRWRSEYFPKWYSFRGARSVWKVPEKKSCTIFFERITTFRVFITITSFRNQPLDDFQRWKWKIPPMHQCTRIDAFACITRVAL